jgi:hypothetical protein
MWAGCIRAALSGSTEERMLLNRAVKTDYIRRIKKTPSVESEGVFVLNPGYSP